MAILKQLPSLLRALRPDERSNEIRIIAAHSDLEIARLLGVVYSIDSVRGARQAAARPRPHAAKYISVAIALVADLSPPNVRARLIRRRGDDGPIVILRESDATASDLRNGIDLATQSYRKYGREPPEDVTEELTAAPVSEGAVVSEPPDPGGERMLAGIRAGEPQDIPGIGRAKCQLFATRLE